MFASAIRAARQSKELSQGKLADLMSLSRPRIVQIEHHDNVSEKLFMRAAEALGMTPLELLSFGDGRIEGEG